MRTRWHRLFESFQKENPNPRTELLFQNPYTLLVAVILSAQARDNQVNKVTPGLFALAPNPEKMSCLAQDQIEEAIKSLNLYRSKASYILCTSKILMEKYNSKVPSSLSDLMSLPGVGRKTANVVLNVAFGKKTIGVDTHVMRVSNRIGLSNSKNPEVVENDLLRKVPTKFLKMSHHWLVLHGRYICKSRKPLCKSCMVSSLCDFAPLTK